MAATKSPGFACLGYPMDFRWLGYLLDSIRLDSDPEKERLSEGSRCETVEREIQGVVHKSDDAKHGGQGRVTDAIAMSRRKT